MSMSKTGMALLAALLLGSPVSGFTAQPKSGSDGMMQGMMSGRHGVNMMGEMCSGMMKGGMMQGGMMGHMLPQLPPGNEKLQAQMQAEILQKTGEIMRKYADQIPAQPSK
ncbi:hypothetical protein OL229_11315 [Neisseriaceae bacterium JH1-16]|nr:hypothetical protein [Neisseriaceae bacterium JH1-16]